MIRRRPHAYPFKVIHVKVYGEAEFYMASLKVILIIGLLFMTFVVMLGGK